MTSVTITSKLDLPDAILLRDAHHAVINLISQVYGAKAIVNWLLAKIPDCFSASHDAKYNNKNLAFFDFVAFIKTSPTFDSRKCTDVRNLFPSNPQDFDLSKMEVLDLIKICRNFFPVFEDTDPNHVLWHSKRKDPVSNRSVEEELHDLISKLNQHRIPADICAIRVIGWLRSSYSHKAHTYNVEKMKCHLHHAQSAVLYLLATNPEECEKMGRVCDILKSLKVMRTLETEHFFQTMNKTLQDLREIVEKFLIKTHHTVFDHSTHDHSRMAVTNVYNIRMSDGVVVNFPKDIAHLDGSTMMTIDQQLESDDSNESD